MRNKKTKSKSEKQTALEWFFDNIKSYFEKNYDLYEKIIITYAIARQKETKQNCLKCLAISKNQRLFCDEHYIEYLKYVDERNRKDKKEKVKKTIKNK